MSAAAGAAAAAATLSHPSSLFQALDNKVKMPTRNIGEKGHIQHSWISPNSNTQEAFIQLYFQMVRAKTAEESLTFKNKFSEILRECKSSGVDWSHGNNYEVAQYLYKLIGHTRDIIDGKGERTLAYAGITSWYDFNPQQAKFLLKSFVHYLNEDGSIGEGHQYGSWNDIKYFCNYLRKLNYPDNHEMIEYAVEIISEQIKSDIKNSQSGNSVSLAIRHMPKQGKTNGWLYRKIAMNVFPYHKTATKKSSRDAAINKAEMHLRNAYSRINRNVLTTPQVFMASGCKGEGEWDHIDFGKLTSKTIRAYPKAFRNVTKKGGVRSTEQHRTRCAENYKSHMEKVSRGEAKVSGKRCNPYELVKDVINTGVDYRSDEDSRINGQWLDKMSDALPVDNFVPIVDVSGSMNCDEGVPMYSAIGLGIRLSETSKFKNRIMTFSESPSWVKFNDTDTFCDKVRKTRTAPWGMTTNLYKAMKMILDAIVENNIPPDEVENMVLAIFSDMQIDVGDKSANTVSDNIQDMYHEAGMKSRYRTPYNVPHILWWNLRTTSGFPDISTRKNTTMLSGYSDALMNAFYGKGMDALKDFTPRKLIYDILDNKRYSALTF